MKNITWKFVCLFLLVFTNILSGSSKRIGSKQSDEIAVKVNSWVVLVCSLLEDKTNIIYISQSSYRTDSLRTKAFTTFYVPDEPYLDRIQVEEYILI